MSLLGVFVRGVWVLGRMVGGVLALVTSLVLIYVASYARAGGPSGNSPGVNVRARIARTSKGIRIMTAFAYGIGRVSCTCKVTGIRSMRTTRSLVIFIARRVTRNGTAARGGFPKVTLFRVRGLTGCVICTIPMGGGNMGKRVSADSAVRMFDSCVNCRPIVLTAPTTVSSGNGCMMNGGVDVRGSFVCSVATWGSTVLSRIMLCSVSSANSISMNASGGGGTYVVRSNRVAILRAANANAV